MAGQPGCPNIPSGRAMPAPGPARRLGRMNVIEVTNLDQALRRPHAPSTASRSRSRTARSSRSSARTAPARPPPSSRSAGCARPTSGTISVLGLDPRRDRDELRRVVGVQLQESELPDEADGRRGARPLRLVLPRARRLASGSGRGLGPGRQARTRRSASSRAARSSGCRSRWPWSATRGSRSSTSSPPASTRRPAATRGSSSRTSATGGVTVVLVTHFMEEAERLADRIALIDAGRVVALDTPAGIVVPRRRRAAAPVPAVRPDRRRPADRAARGSDRDPRWPDRGRRRHRQPRPGGHDRPGSHSRSWPTTYAIDQADLDDAFVALTGRKLAS